MGKVYLMGAGPGDEELITLKAVKCLEKCTAVLYDRLANHNLLRYLREDCKIYYCGKQPGCHYKTQEQINDMLVVLAKEGYTVGRIKGGDPYVFGRGGEEALRLREEGMDFEVIPGITSAIAVPDYAGIPVTHRKIARSFHVFTGKSAEAFEIDWDAAVRMKGTLIFLMGLESIEKMIASLVKHGMDATIPCAVIMRGTTSKQQKVVGNLEDITIKVKEAGFTSPCIIIVGEVVSLHEELDWYGRKPLAGRNVCITRSKEQSQEIREKLLDLGAEVTEINTICVKNTSEQLDPYITSLEQYNYAVFTSVNGVNIFFDKLKKQEYDIRKIGAHFVAIGPTTVEAIKQRGIIPHIVAEKFVAESLLEALKPHVHKGDRILLPGQKNARTFLKEALQAEECVVDAVPIYEIVPGQLPDPEVFEPVDVVLFTSPSTVRNLIGMVGLEQVRKKRCIAIGPITKKELEQYDIPSEVCEHYEVDGFIDKLL